MTIVVQFPPELGVVAPERFAMGGMAEIYRAEKIFPQGGRYGVVVKHMMPQFNGRPDMVRRFRDEARLGLRLRHGNIARVLEYQEIEGHHYIIMERVDGYDLQEVASVSRDAEVPIPEAVLAHFMASIASALAYMTDATDAEGASLDLVHRDISPSNVLISHGGTVKLIDFGVAWASEREARTATGHLVGKYAYMSPEQIVGDHLDIRSDLFALGTVAYELLTGRRAFRGGSDFETFSLVTSSEPPPLTLMRPGLHPIIEAAVTRCMEKDPADRYAHPEGLVLDLARYFHDRVARPPPLLARRFLEEFESLERIDLADGGGLEQVSEPGVTMPVSPVVDGPPRRADRLGPAEEPSLDGTVPVAVVASSPAESRRLPLALLLTGVAAAVVLAVVVAVVVSLVGPTPAETAVAVDGGGDAVAPPTPEEHFAEISIEDDVAPPIPAEIAPVAPQPDRVVPPTEEHPTTGSDEPPAQEAAGPGTISVSSIPWVDVWIDGERIGRTPLVDYSLPTGPHRFEYRNSERGWERSEVVTIAPGPNRDIRIRLDE